MRQGDDRLPVLALLLASVAGSTISWLGSMADGLAHPGVIALPLRDGPPVRTSLARRSNHDNPILEALVDLATAWTRDGGRTRTRR